MESRSKGGYPMQCRWSQSLFGSCDSPTGNHVSSLLYDIAIVILSNFVNIGMAKPSAMLEQH